MTRKEMLDQMNNFELAVFFMLEENDLAVALCENEMTADQRKRFDQIKSAFLEEQLQDCPFKERLLGQ